MFRRLLSIKLRAKYLLFRTFSCRVNWRPVTESKTIQIDETTGHNFKRGCISDIDEDLVLRLQDVTMELYVSPQARFIVLDT